MKNKENSYIYIYIYPCSPMSYNTDQNCSKKTSRTVTAYIHLMWIKRKNDKLNDKLNYLPYMSEISLITYKLWYFHFLFDRCRYASLTQFLSFFIPDFPLV